MLCLAGLVMDIGELRDSSATVRVVRDDRIRRGAWSLVVSCRAEEFKRLFNSFFEFRVNCKDRPSR